MPNVPATVAFYEKAFGLTLRYMHPSSGYAELETGDTLLAFVGDEFIADLKLLGDLHYTPNRVEDTAAAGQLAFVTDDLDSNWERATPAGAVVVKALEAKPWGQPTGYMRDCNGVIVELCTRSLRDGT